MNLNMIRPENETEHLLLSITKHCETPNVQTHRKPGETLEFKMNKELEFKMIINPLILMEK